VWVALAVDLLRFCRARKWDREAIKDQLFATIKVRCVALVHACVCLCLFVVCVYVCVPVCVHAPTSACVYACL
jgi:hypothetical protein